MGRNRNSNTLTFSSLTLTLVALASGMILGQNAAAAGAPDKLVSTNWAAQTDHMNMMEQLGIRRLRPGPSGQRGATNEANYDPAKANP